MNFIEAAKKNAEFTRTENGAVALNTTSDARLDLFGTIGSLREASDDRIEYLFNEAFHEDPLFATKIAFYARDVRGGLGERRVFRVVLKNLATYHPEALRPNLSLIAEYGRFDDLYTLIGTVLEDEMWDVMKKQFETDREDMEAGKPISLLAKWIKTADSKSKETRSLGILTAMKLGYSVYEFKRIVRSMRKYIRVVEAQMSSGRWGEIDYSAVPSRAMMIYRNAFGKHDGARFAMFTSKVFFGEEKINSSTLYPYDIIERELSRSYASKEETILEAQWRALPNYVGEGMNALVIADTSGSMHGRPICTSLGLAIYFAERNAGAYHNMWISFSAQPHIHELKGETLRQKLSSIDMHDWMMNTDLKAAFDLVLEIAVENDVSAHEMPKSLIVISDMEIDYCGNKDWTFYDKMQKKFKKHGYEIPNIIFWNVNSRHDIFHADSKRKGVQLCSGQSAAVFKQVMECVGMTPVEAMEKIINSERYAAIRVE